MTHALIVDRTVGVQRVVEEKAAIGLTYATCPRATAVAAVLVDKLRGGENLVDVPLEELVTPARLEGWRRIFEDPAERAAAVATLSGYHPAFPCVVPEPDGGVAVLLVWLHPDQDELLTFTRETQVMAYPVHCRLVENPDDWRVERIG